VFTVRQAVGVLAITVGNGWKLHGAVVTTAKKGEKTTIFAFCSVNQTRPLQQNLHFLGLDSGSNPSCEYNFPINFSFVSPVKVRCSCRPWVGSGCKHGAGAGWVQLYWFLMGYELL